MALHYQTEYRLGNRGRICRSYTGFQAFLAIGFDLVFGLLFELVMMAFNLGVRVAIMLVQLAVEMIKINWRLLVAAMTLLVYLLTLPFAMIHEAVNHFRSRGESESASFPPHPAHTGKPDWAFAREV
jgi:hypothetical protein